MSVFKGFCPHVWWSSYPLIQVECTCTYIHVQYPCFFVCRIFKEVGRRSFQYKAPNYWNIHLPFRSSNVFLSFNFCVQLSFSWFLFTNWLKTYLLHFSVCWCNLLIIRVIVTLFACTVSVFVVYFMSPRWPPHSTKVTLPGLLQTRTHGAGVESQFIQRFADNDTWPDAPCCHAGDLSLTVCVVLASLTRAIVCSMCNRCAASASPRFLSICGF